MRDIRIIIAGSRDFNNYPILKEKCNNVINDICKKAILLGNIDINNITIISGTAKGADTLGEQYAKEKDIKIKRFPADWNNYGKAAGHIRNKEMANYAIQNNAYGILIAFPIKGKSKGTNNMIELAKQYGLETYVFQC